MKGKMIQGQSETAVITVKDYHGSPVNIAIFDVKVFIVNTATYETIAQYAYPQEAGYYSIKIESTQPPNSYNYGVIRVPSTATSRSVIGNIEAQVHLTLPDMYSPDQKLTIVHKGKLARMLRAKRN